MEEDEDGVQEQSEHEWPLLGAVFGDVVWGQAAGVGLSAKGEGHKWGKGQSGFFINDHSAIFCSVFDCKGN